jgi:glycosyltransferase involved in cell wall biosynthesis
LRGAAYLHVTSEAEYADAARVPLLPLPAACVVPNGVDIPDFSALPPPSRAIEHATRTPYLLFLGRLSWKKGLDRLLASLAGTPYRLLIAGPDEGGYQQVLHKLSREHGLGGQVEFLGAVHGADKWWLLRAARCLALTSYNENFGNVVAEALAAGTPVVVTPEVAIEAHELRARAGLVVDGAADALRHALGVFWHDAQRREQAGAAGRRYAAERLSWASAAERMLSYYAGLDENQGRAVALRDQPVQAAR